MTGNSFNGTDRILLNNKLTDLDRLRLGQFPVLKMGSICLGKHIFTMLALVSLPPVVAFAVFDDVLAPLFVEIGAICVLTSHDGVYWMAVPEIVRGWRRILVSLGVIPYIETDIPGPEDI
jgi:hypothetical protein